jgi:hypothetical protein
MLGEASTLGEFFHAKSAGSLTHNWTESVLCSPIAYGFEKAYGFDLRTESTMAAAAAAAGALGLGDEVDEKNEEALAAGGDPEDPAGWAEDSDEDNDDPPLNEEAVEDLKADFHNSLGQQCCT